MSAAILDRARALDAATKAPTCPACEASMHGPVDGYRFECRRCRCFRSTLAVAIDGGRPADRGDEAAFDAAIARTRQRNFGTVLDRLERYVPTTGSRILEVGCAYGAFLEAAGERGYAACGIEPDAGRATRAMQNVAGAGSVWRGYFPQDVPRGER
jgi:hypothetical protein